MVLSCYLTVFLSCSPIGWTLIYHHWGVGISPPIQIQASLVKQGKMIHIFVVMINDVTTTKYCNSRICLSHLLWFFCHFMWALFELILSGVCEISDHILQLWNLCLGPPSSLLFRLTVMWMKVSVICGQSKPGASCMHIVYPVHSHLATE